MIGRARRTAELAISERELSSMTADVAALHEDTFPAVHPALTEFSASANTNAATGRSTERRSFLVGVGGVLVLGAAAACSKSKGTAGRIGSPSPATGGDQYPGELAMIAVAAALENLAVIAYRGAQTKAAKGQLGIVPPAVTVFVSTVMKQHTDHAAAWNSMLTMAGKTAISGAPLTITKDQVTMVNAARSVPDVARLALALENAAAHTYIVAAAEVTDPGAIMMAATIQPVETMHAAILNFMLGEYPVPASFIGTSNAVMPSALTG